jgi:hypothetical protein
MKILIFFIAIIYKTLCEHNTTETESTSTERTDDLFYSINGLTVRSEKTIREILSSTDMTYFVYVYLKTSPNSRAGAELVSRVAEKLEFIAGILLIDCDDYETDNPKICERPEGAKDGFPKMFLYVPPEYKYNPYTKEMNEHTIKPYSKNEVSDSLIYNFITQNIPSRSVQINAENHETFMSNFALNKVILFTEKAKAPLMWRGLSNYFYDRLAFGHVGKDQTALIKKYAIQTFPTIIIHQVHDEEAPLETPKYEMYIGKLDAPDIAKALEGYALEEKNYVRAKNMTNPEELKFKVVFKQLNKDNYIEYFKKHEERKYVAFLSNTDDIPESVRRFNKETAGFFNFVKLNCKESFCKEKFNFKTLPQMVLFKYNPQEDLNTQISTGKVLPYAYYDSIYREIIDIFPDEFKPLDHYELQKTIMESATNKKTPLLYFYDDADIPIALRLLSSNPTFRKYVDFIDVSNPPKELLNQFKLKSLPQLLFIVISDPTKPDS